MSRGRLFTLRDPRLPPLIAAALAAVGSLPVLRFAYHRLPIVRGWEAEAIAQALIKEHGYSFPANTRWLWEMGAGDPNQYFPTAWVDPVYTFVLAGAHVVFGEYAFAAIYALCFACLAIIYGCAYQLAKRFGGPWSGVIAVALLAMHTAFGKSFFDDITNSALAGCLLVIAVLLGVRYVEQPTVRRLVIAGLGTGLMVLTCPAAQYYPIALMIALVMLHRHERPQMFVRPLAFIALVAVVLAPWTIRNYLAFGEFVLVRNGAGQIAWDGTVGPAESFMPGAARSTEPAPWRSSGPRDAVNKMLDKDLRVQMEIYQVKALMAAPPPGYEQMNEAERDKLYLARTQEFVRAHPGVAARMAAAKLEVFALNLEAYGAVLLAVAILGALLTLRDARSWPITLAVLCYGAPFLLIIAYYGRYRAPVEPLIGVLAAVAVSTIAARLIPNYFSRRLAIGHT